jgi:hypothetical protein
MPSPHQSRSGDTPRRRTLTSPAENLFCEKCHLTLPTGWHRYDAPVPKSDVLAYATRTGSGDYPPHIVISGEGSPMTMRSFRSKAPRIMRYRAKVRGATR